MAHLWLMQAVKEELKKNNGAFVISASVAGLRPGGSSMVSVPGLVLAGLGGGRRIAFVALRTSVVQRTLAVCGTRRGKQPQVKRRTPPRTTTTQQPSSPTIHKEQH